MSIHSDSASSGVIEPFVEETPPVYSIDLSLPPAKRHVKVAQDLKEVLRGLPALFDELVVMAGLPKRVVHFIARLVFRKLHANEQTEELRGISETINVPMYLLVAYNVLLDLFMGCTSGGVMVKEKTEKQKRMLHFRTLDWGMPELRKAVVQFEFKESQDGPVIAKAINYAGFVGILTACKKDLSVSLNFRPYHNHDTSLFSNIRYRAHQALVLLGYRPSIATHLRNLVLPVEQKDHESQTPKLADIAKDFPRLSTTAAYVIFCDGEQTLILEKDRITAKPLTSRSFIAVTNHDVSYEKSSEKEEKHAAHAKKKHEFGVGMEELVEESVERKNCLVKNWEKRTRRFGEKTKANDGVYVSSEELKGWLGEYPVTNGQTHFATLMDPKKGDFAWIQWYPEEEDDSDWGSDSGVSTGESI